MRKQFWKGLFGLITSILLIGCATQTPQAPFEAQALPADQYRQKVDNVMVILDTSWSMVERYENQRKLTYAKEIVSRMNQTIPDLKLTGALRDFPLGGFSREKSRLVYGLTAYSKTELEDALQKLKTASGISPLAAAMDAAGADFKSTQGDIALIIVSDGKDMAKAPVVAAENLKGLFGDRLCIHTVLVGNCPSGKKVMEKVARAGQCGVSVSADDIASAEGMAGFVETVFLEKRIEKVVTDSDGDGVPDCRDKCPNTPKGVKVDKEGCPLDSDGDGVPDHLDECPDTPKGATVNSVGCWALKGVVLFDFNKSDIKPEAHRLLDEVVAILKKNPEIKGVIEGHTDSIGSEEYNQGLSEKRAQAVEKYIEEHGIDADRYTVKGYGESKPIASNDTAEGQQENRRVELRRIR
jgi:OOP family OmpA-OmpF porin